MSKPKFKVGDRVKLDGSEYRLAHYEIPQKYAKKIGTVYDQHKSGSNFVEFDDGARYYAPDYLCIAINEKIIIYRNGAEVVAKNTATGKTGVARCNPADEFDFNTGAKLAFERLTNPEPEKPKYYNGKVVCIDSKTSSFTKGKIYVVTNGNLNSNDGVYEYHRFTSFADIQGTLASEFIELAE